MSDTTMTKPATRMRVDIGSDLRTQLADLARKHDRTLAGEIRHAVRAWVAEHNNDDTPAA